MIALVMPGPTELALIFAIVFVLFGAKKVPEFARGIGEAIREFKKSRDELTRVIEEESKDDDRKS